MILHLVLIRFKPGTEPARIVRALDGMLAIRPRIPEIREISWSPNLGPSSEEYSHVLRVILDDMGAVQRYLDHPVHKAAVVEQLGEIREARLAIDIETSGDA